MVNGIKTNTQCRLKYNNSAKIALIILPRQEFDEL